MHGTDRLVFETSSELLERGTPEDRATFAAIGIHCGDCWLTEAEDLLVGRTRREVHLSAYRMAEWLAWNWWRLRWEPYRPTAPWGLAHRMATIGGGYVWPNVTIVSDGARVILNPVPTQARPSEPLRYISSVPVLIDASNFEAGVSSFIERVIAQLRPVGDTNLHAVWRSVREETLDAATARFRKLEAMLGWDPGEVSDALIARIESEAADLGESAVEELAANGRGEQVPLGRDDIVAMAQHVGIFANPRDAVRLANYHDQLRDDVPAWLRGASAARALREQLGSREAHISDERLCTLAGIMQGAADYHPDGAPISFELDQNAREGKVVLRARNPNSRRFDIARILGDTVIERSTGRLRPVTRSGTYRQKMQRSFAAEFLAPIDALTAFLEKDFSEESLEDAADYFGVSDFVVRLQLLNNHVISRDELSDDILYMSDTPDMPRAA